MTNPNYYTQPFEEDNYELNMTLYDCVLNPHSDSVISLLCEKSDIFKQIGYKKDIMNLVKYDN